MGAPTIAVPVSFRPKPRLTFWEIWNMSFGFLGIQIGFALQNANVSRIFETLGARVEDIPILWIAAPVTGLVIQPIVGYFSDRTWNRLGRRRPYFLGGAILASVALIVMPNSPALWVAAGMLWIMDASINISMEPFRAFVGDNLAASQRTTGFALQSFFIGTGAVVASMLPWLLTRQFSVSNEAAAGQIPASVPSSYTSARRWSCSPCHGPCSARRSTLPTRWPPSPRTRRAKGWRGSGVPATSLPRTARARFASAASCCCLEACSA